jgi:ribosome-associated translation inhibitor RaiA
MRITIRSPHVTIDQDQRQDIAEAVRTALAHVESRVVSVQVLIDDSNGPKGGVDQRCEFVANCGKLGVLRVEAASSELKKAVNSALTKLRRAAEHAVDHKRGERKDKVPHRRA